MIVGKRFIGKTDLSDGVHELSSKNDMENSEKYHWVEVCPPLGRWFKEEGGNPIPSKLAPGLLHIPKNKITTQKLLKLKRLKTIWL